MNAPAAVLEFKPIPLASKDHGSLRRVPIDLSYARVPKGRVFVVPDRCKGCRYCIVFCPQNVLADSQTINVKGYHYPVVPESEKENCVHCGFCNLVCPEMAIYTEEVEPVQATRTEDTP